MASKLVIAVVSVAVLFLFVFVLFIDSGKAELHEATGLALSVESFPVYMETHPLIKALPDDASVSLIIGGQAYGISGKINQVDKVLNDADISIELPSGYEHRIGEVGLCSAVNEAVKNGDLSFETKLSKTKLFLKYYKLVKYRKCVEG